MLEQAHHRITIETEAPGFTDVTAALAGWLTSIGAGDGLLTVFVRHTSASLTIQENADPDVQTDLMTALDRLAPRAASYVHDTEGPDDMPAHIRAMLTGAAAAIPVLGGKLALGTWQGLYLVEHRDRPHRREVVLHVVGA
jgi:secondary thiamine-phosphate synthase enzyme